MKSIVSKLRCMLGKLCRFARPVAATVEESKSWPGGKRTVRFRNVLIACSNDNKIEKKILDQAEGYDYANFEVIQNIVNPGCVCFDVGANIGVYSTVLAALVGAAGEVHCFEPVDHIRKHLLLNLQINGVKNVKLNNFALGAEEGSFEMYQVKPGVFRGGTSTLVRNNNVDIMGDDSFEMKPARVVALDSYMMENNVSRLDFVKIDVEGYELKVLQGGAGTISKFRPSILMEYDQKRLQMLGVEDGDFIDVLSGYAFYELRASSSMLFIRPFSFDRKIAGNNLLCLPTQD